MKLNMYLLTDWLSKFDIQPHIEDGTDDITGIRFFSEDFPEAPEHYVYAGKALDVIHGEKYENAILLLNGHDMIFVLDQALETVINEILICFEYYHTWESRLAESSRSENSLQNIVSLCADTLKACVSLCDFNGNIIEMSFTSPPKRLQDYWRTAQETGSIPVSATENQFFDGRGNFVTDFTTKPAIYYFSDGTKYIGTYIEISGEAVATLLVQENEKILTPGDCLLISMVCAAIHDTIQMQNDIRLLYLTASVKNLVEGNRTEESCRFIEEKAALRSLTAPWVILAIRYIPYNYVEIAKGRLCTVIHHFQTPNLSVVYQNEVIALVSADKLDAFLRELQASIQPSQYIIGISLPFLSLSRFASRYRQAIYATETAEKQPGIYDAKELAFPYLIQKVAESSRELEFVHPALDILRKYDQEKNTDLYPTLIAYLSNERNTINTAGELFIHRNTLSARITKILDLTGIDLENSQERMYILLSHLVNKQ